VKLRKVLLPTVRNVLARHATTGAGVGAVLQGDSLEAQAAGVAALLVSLGFAICDEVRKRRRAHAADVGASRGPA
jgi:hypothetical protein